MLCGDRRPRLMRAELESTEVQANQDKRCLDRKHLPVRSRIIFPGHPTPHVRFNRFPENSW